MIKKAIPKFERECYYCDNCSEEINESKDRVYYEIAGEKTHEL